MGIIILGQPNFIKFEPDSKVQSGIACFVVALLEALIVVAIHLYQHRQHIKTVGDKNYIDLNNETDHRPRQSTFKGIAMADMALLREPPQSL